MAILLSEAEKREIRDAVKDVTDTFMVTPILYHASGSSLEVWAEDKKDEVFTTYLLSALAEPNEGAVKDAISRTLQGATDWADVTLTFNLEDLQSFGLVDANLKSTFIAETDYFTWKNTVYNVLDVSYDGPLDAKEVLIKITGKITTLDLGLDEVIVSDGNGGTESRNISDILNQLLEPHEHIKFEDLPPLP